MTAPVAVSKAAVVEALAETWASLADLGAGLSADEWRVPSGLPGWTVKDLYAHIVGTESSLAGEPAPDAGPDVRAYPHVHNDIGALNEAWVESLRPLPGAEVLARLRSVTARRLEALEAMTEEEFSADSWTPAGPGTYGRFMQIRVYDCWVHEQDARDALGRPGHESGPAAEQALDEVERALGYIVGKKAAVPDRSAVTFDLTGPVTRTIHVAVDGRAAVVASLDRPAAVVARMPEPVFLRLAAGRLRASDHLGEVVLEGDADLGRRVVESLNFTI